MAKNRCVFPSIVFGGTIASAGQDQQVWVNNGDTAVEIYGIQADVHIHSAAASANNIAAYDESLSASSATGTIPGRHQFRLKLEGSSQGPITDNTNGNVLSNVAGTALKPLFLQEPIRIERGETLKATLWNDSASSVRGQLDFLARKVN